jgi:heptosyltransferase III
MRILVVRRDNIGDLVCTTPLLSALRLRFPGAWIAALVNTYNAPVLEGNGDLDEVIAYEKLKHLEAGRSAVAALAARLASLWRLRRGGLDQVLLATPDFVPRTARLMRWLAPRQLVGYSDGSAAARVLDLAVPVAAVARGHEVERVFALARLLGIEGEIPPLKLLPAPAEVRAAQARIGGAGPRIALHISARRPAQRWPPERFVQLAEALPGTAVLLWSPGSADHPRHPGDDEKARAILAATRRAVPYPTLRLQQLIGVLAACDAVVCSDGGASHLAAALGKPVVCLFGDSSAERWRPWGAAHRVLQPASRQVRDISVDEVLEALRGVRAVLGHPVA